MVSIPTEDFQRQFGEAGSACRLAFDSLLLTEVNFDHLKTATASADSFKTLCSSLPLLRSGNSSSGTVAESKPQPSTPTARPQPAPAWSSTVDFDPTFVRMLQCGTAVLELESRTEQDRKPNDLCSQISDCRQNQLQEGAPPSKYVRKKSDKAKRPSEQLQRGNSTTPILSVVGIGGVFPAPVIFEDQPNAEAVHDLFTDPDDPSGDAIPGMTLAFAPRRRDHKNGKFALQPLLKKKVIELVGKCSLCLLTTTKQTEVAFGGLFSSEPHLSLMKFTYDRYSNVIIMTTRRDTQRFRNLRQNSRVAVMLHDFPEPERSESGAITNARTLSNSGALTLYGRARMPVTEEVDELFRDIHMNNPLCEGSVHLILPKEEFQVVLVEVHFGKMVDINDRVVSFDYLVKGAGSGSRMAETGGSRSSRTPDA